MAYSKLHSSIVNSSLWTETDSARILFITLLAICDRDGVVYGSRVGIDRIANINPEDSEEAWNCLMTPDKNSSDKIRAPENQGRRIEEVSGGFKLINFEYYRGLRNDDDRREQNRTAQARFKAKVSPDKPETAAVSPVKPMQRQRQIQSHTHTDQEGVCVTEEEGESRKEKTSFDDDLANDLMQVYRRPKNSKLSFMEQSALAEIFRERSRYREEWEIIATLKQKEPRYFPQSLSKLLTNWQETLDRASCWVPEGKPVKSLIEKALEQIK